MNRSEHMAWCKERALEYLDKNDIQQAYVSMVSDLGKHAETENHLGIQLGMGLMLAGHLSTVSKMKEFILGFN